NDSVAVVLQPHGVLLVALGASRVHGIQELSGLVSGVANHAVSGRAIHVNIENVQKYADPREFLSIESSRTHSCDLSIGGRHNETCLRRNYPLRVTKKPHEECGQEHRNNGPPWTGEPAHEQR